MAHQSNDLVLAWKSLSGVDSIPGWQAISLEPVGPVEIQAGKRTPGNLEAILLSFPKGCIPSIEKLPEGQGFSVERVFDASSDSTQVALTRKPAGSPELFLIMANDVVSTLASASMENASTNRLLRVFLGRVGAWQEFMRKGSMPLSAESEVGLVGELKLLSRLIEEGVPVNIAVNAWTGPTFDGLRDFALGAGAIEVKTTISSNGFVAKIGSLEQLDDTHCKPLFVGALKFSLVETGQTLPELVAEISEMVSIDPYVLAEFENRLLSASYLTTHAHHYHRRFSPQEEKIIQVDDDFPCITHGNIKTGVVSARYEINLEQLLNRDVGLANALKNLGMI